MASAITLSVALVGQIRPLYAMTLGAFTDINAGIADDYGFGGHLTWGDYDNDGDLDLLVTGGSGVDPAIETFVFRNTGGSFSPVDVGLPTMNSTFAAWGDYDRDGDLDLAMTGGIVNYAQNMFVPAARIFRNDGGTFVDIAAGLPALQQGGVDWGDFDNDGDLDLAMCGWLYGQAQTKIFRNTDGQFADTQADITPLHFCSVDWGDYDNDGDLDLLVNGADTANQTVTRVFRNISGTFSDIQAALSGTRNGNAMWGDLDNDGDLDVVVSGLEVASVNVALREIFRNDGGSFTSIERIAGGAWASRSAWGDFNNDGYSDLAIINNTGNLGALQLFQNNSSGSWVAYNDALPPMESGMPAWGDFDNDRDLDIAFVGCATTSCAQGSMMARILRNDFAASNTAPSAPIGLNANLNDLSATLSWNAASDNNTGNSGLTYNLRVGTAPGSDNIVASMSNPSTGFRRIAQDGNVGHRLSWTLNGLHYGQTYYWSVQAIDVAFVGSAWATEGSFTLVAPDTAQPTGSISISNINRTIGTQSVSLQVSASDTGGSGLQQMRFSNDGNIWGDWAAYYFYSSWMLSPGDGVKTVYAQFRDGAGNISATATDTVTLDTARPTGSIALNGGTAYINQTNFDAWVGCSDSSLITAMRLSNRPDTTLGVLAYPKSVPFISGNVLATPWSLADETAGGSTTNGLRTVYMQCRDSANNWSAVLNDSIFLDTIAPTATLSISGNAVSTTDINVSLSLQGSDAEPASGLKQMRFSNDGTNWSNWESYSANKSWTLPTGDGLKVVFVQVQDNAGNISVADQDAIALANSTPDSVAPSVTLRINDGASLTNDVAITLTISVTDPAPSAGLGKMRFRNGDAEWSNWEAYTPTRTWQLAAGNGEKTLSVQVRDSAGNVSAVAQATIRLDSALIDSVAPVGTIIINDNDATTPNTTVTLTLEVSDPAPSAGVATMRLSNDGVVWSEWGPYTATKPWTLLPDDGNKTVYAQFRDHAGNESAIVQDSITLVGLPIVDPPATHQIMLPLLSR